MFDSDLAVAVERFASVTRAASAADLERSWAWNDYDSEGVRFAFFRVYESLRELAGQLAELRSTNGLAITGAQRILGLYHAAYRDLGSLLRGLTDDVATREPAAGEWPALTIVRHIAEADGGFLVLISYALQRHRSGDGRPAKIPDSFWQATLGSEEAYDAALGSSFTELTAYHAMLHQRILGELYDIDDSELALPSTYWESYELPLRFRLHRLDSHLRQHTVQLEKTLAALGLEPSEPQRLLRLIDAALADAEAVSLGAAAIGADLRKATADAIALHTGEIAAILKG